MVEEAEKRISASKTGASGSPDDTVSAVERTVAQEVVADAVLKLIGVEVSPSDIDSAISATLEERLQ